MSRKKKYNKAIVILGPTTTGKTEVAFQVAQQLDGEVINGDKFYLFSKLDLLTGLSNQFREREIPFHLYSILEPSAESLPLVDYLLLVSPLVRKILDKARLPIIEGCSYGYTRALLDLNKLSEKSIYGPFVGLRLPNNYDINSRVEERINKLFEEGLMEEVRANVEQGYRYAYPIRRGIIAVPAIELFDGKISEDEAKDKIRIGILNAYYLNLRKFLDVPGIEWIEHLPENLERTVSKIKDLVIREKRS